MITRRLGNDAGMHEFETFLAGAHLSALDCSKGSTREVEDERQQFVPCLNHSHQEAFVSVVGMVLCSQHVDARAQAIRPLVCLKMDLMISV